MTSAPKVQKKMNLVVPKWNNHLNPIFRFLKINTNLKNSNCLLELLEQLRFLWSHEFILLFFDSKTKPENVSKTNVKGYISNKFDKTMKKKSILFNKNESVYRICSFYRKILILIVFETLSKDVFWKTLFWDTFC